MNMKIRFQLFLLCAAMWIALTTASHASILTYHNDFGPSDDTLDFASAKFTLNTGAGTLNYLAQDTTATNYFATEQITNINTSAGAGFVMKTKFTLDGTVLNSTADASIGLMFLGAANNGGSAYYLADWRITQSAAAPGIGRLRLVNVGAPALASVANTTVAPVAAGTYVMQLEGIYDVTGALNLQLGIYDATGTVLLGSEATAVTSTTPGAGQFFGIRNRSAIQGGGSPAGGWTTSASFDYLTIASIPEPGSLVLALVCTVSSFFRRGGV
jgi:hypothetical protein